MIVTLLPLILAIASLGAPGPAFKVDQPTVDRDNRQMCEQVAHELNEWYIEGNISESKARAIIDRCFATFVD